MSRSMRVARRGRKDGSTRVGAVVVLHIRYSTLFHRDCGRYGARVGVVVVLRIRYSTLFHRVTRVGAVVVLRIRYSTLFYRGCCRCGAGAVVGVGVTLIGLDKRGT